MTNETKIVPVEPSNQKLADRLSALATAVTKRDWSEFTMRIPADPKRDADLVLSEAARRLRAIEAAPAPDDEEKIVQVSGFGVENTSSTQCNYMLVGLTNTGRVVLSMGDREWCDVSPACASKERLVDDLKTALENQHE